MYSYIYFTTLLAISYNGVSVTAIISDVSKGDCKEPNSYLPVEGSCDFYIICKNNKKSNEICPDGLTFDSTVKYPNNPCKFPIGSNPCEGRVSQKAKPTAECPRQYGFFPSASGDKKDCTQYRICAKGRATVKSCPNDFVFNPANSHCDYRTNVPSCQEKKPEADKSTPTGETSSAKNEATGLPKEKPQIADPAIAKNSTDVSPTQPEENKPSKDTTSTVKDDEKKVVPPTENTKPTVPPGLSPVTAVITIGSINMTDVNMKIPVKRK